MTARPRVGSARPTTARATFFFALYWAQALAAQTDDTALATHFAPVAEALARNEAKILAELARDEGKPVDLGGYYHTDRSRRRR